MVMMVIKEYAFNSLHVDGGILLLYQVCRIHNRAFKLSRPSPSPSPSPSSLSPSPCFLPDGGDVYVWGHPRWCGASPSSTGAVSRPVKVYPVPSLVGDGVERIVPQIRCMSSGFQHSILVAEDNTLLCWGHNRR